MTRPSWPIAIESVTRASLRTLIEVWVWAGLLTLLLTLVRAAQTVHFWPSSFQASGWDVARVLVQGARFDLKVSAILGWLIWPLLPWLSARLKAWAFAGVALLGVLLSIINWHYFGFYKTPIDVLVFGFLEDDTGAIVQTVWRDFAVLRSLGASCALTLLGWQLYRWLVPYTHRIHIRHHGLELLTLLVLAVALAFSAKGTLRAMALQRQHMTVTTSPFLNDMVPNGIIALKYAWDSRGLSQNLRDPLVGLKKMGFNSPAAAAQVLGLAQHDEAHIKAALTQHTALPTGTPKKNLLFFLMESFSAEPLLYQSPRFDVAGRLNQVMGSACHFHNFDSAQPGTHPSLEAILFSTPISPLTLGSAGRRTMPWAAAQVAKQAGYQTLFITSGRAGWRDLNRVLKVQGFDEVIDASTLQAHYPQAPLGIWGTWDRYAFDYLRERLAQQPLDQPIFVFVLTSTNHPPYDLPPDYMRVPRDLSLWQGETSDAALSANLDTYHYAADLLGGFVQSVQNSPLKTSTVIAATGDHNVRTFGLYTDPARRHLMRQVPFLIWGADSSCGPQTAAPASHRDMFNTLWPLVGVNGPYLNTGRNLLSTPAPGAMSAPRAVFYPGEARNAQGRWQLGNPASFTGSGALDAEQDAQERARLGLLDWYIRTSLPP